MLPRLLLLVLTFLVLATTARAEPICTGYDPKYTFTPAKLTVNYADRWVGLVFQSVPVGNQHQTLNPEDWHSLLNHINQHGVAVVSYYDHIKGYALAAMVVRYPNGKCKLGSGWVPIALIG